MENEMPIDIESENSDGAMTSETDNPEQGASNMPAKHMLLQQISMSKYGQLVQQSREELLVEQSSGSKPVQHKGILVEKGIMECSNNYELIGDCGSTGNAEEMVHQTRDEFVEQLCSDPKYAHVKGVLIEKGILEDSSDPDVDQDGYVETSSDLGSLEKELEEYCRTTPKRPVDMPTSIEDMMSYINEFTEGLNTNSNVKDWDKFRGCIREVHDFHMNKKAEHENVEENTDEQTHNNGLDLKKDLTQVELDIVKMMQPLNELIQRSQKLTNSIECIENKISRLDLKVDSFYIRYNENLQKREQSFEEMMALQRLRERIGERLTKIETEIHTSKTLLLQGRVQKN
ncbi:uncharacterized protein LOC6582643 [Drosophila mojavensis]|uniref:uncharacterized protein LOC6582643 n=1 Tax=Drosophila mojavensis TaxID=7230 RepID=UPI001CD0E7BE|nr:uncharacterized protein LOC6582643 [Drosophila mojavensis]